MINHLYTFLINTLPNDSLEIIDSRFTPRVLTIPQEAINLALLPSTYPLLHKSLIAKSLELLVWGSPLASDLASIDKRSSIRWSNNADLDLLKNTLSLSEYTNGQWITASLDCPIQPSGNYTPSPITGRFSSSWEIKHYSNSSISITDLETGDSSVHTIDFAENGSNVINLGYGINISIWGVSSIPENLIVNLRAAVPSTINVFEIMNRIKATSDVHSIFQVSSSKVDMAYLSELFFGSEAINENLPAVLVAYAASFEN